MSDGKNYKIRRGNKVKRDKGSKYGASKAGGNADLLNDLDNDGSKSGAKGKNGSTRATFDDQSQDDMNMFEMEKNGKGIKRRSRAAKKHTDRWGSAGGDFMGFGDALSGADEHKGSSSKGYSTNGSKHSANFD